MNIVNLFSTSVFVKNCSLDLEQIKNDCIRHARETESVLYSGTGSQHRIYYNEDLLKEIQESLPQRDDIPLKGLSVEFWVNINKKNDYNFFHHHGPFTGNALSGVFYVQTPKNCGNIRLYDPRFCLANAPDLEYYNDGSSFHFFEPEPNLLLIFPSWLHHFVEHNQSEDDRISISFNIQLDY